ncbi:hypothetical protein C5167_043285 [Papaver somniferum]|uniref:F-box protein n=1 Tax=Papaver somniferum TaxID=3469 RepID=A0A4Y7L7X0_PAPSO|nr:probable F-box protein At4g22030 [Papaver somniferum]RZC80710.1 hypothetical protein C5167_043285 [Papaver somniferum]
MAALTALNLLCSTSYSSISKPRNGVSVILRVLKFPALSHLSLPTLPTNETTTISFKEVMKTSANSPKDRSGDTSPRTVAAELYMIMEVVAERIEMHKNIGEQRNNWNTLLLNSINAITIAATTMSGLASTGVIGSSPSHLLALKISSTLLYSAATGMMVVMNTIQPSQLAEEQRNATRLFKQLHEQIKTELSLSSNSAITQMDVKQAMESVLALDKAYPLPLLGGVMIEKFPKNAKPAIWWPQRKQDQEEKQFANGTVEKNGWSNKLEREMRYIVEALKSRDTEEYVRLSNMVLKINKILAISGPLLTGIGAIGSAFIGSPSQGSTAVFCGVLAGALATLVNTLEHGGQVGIVLEMYKASAGSFQLLEETIDSTLKEKEVEKRENGEIFERWWL